MKIDEDLKELKRAIETYTQLRCILSIESNTRYKNVILDRKFIRKYGLDITELSSAVIQTFYEIGKEDALKELEDKL
tara:strand:- start:422 stop:652 length:231 start_codon:yes stop_codon:yes gene_type:complete